MATSNLSKARELASVAEELAETYRLLEMQQECIDSLEEQMQALAAEYQEARDKHSRIAAEATALQERSQVSFQTFLKGGCLTYYMTGHRPRLKPPSGITRLFHTAAWQ